MEFRNTNEILDRDIPILLYHHLTRENHADPHAYELSLREFEQQLDGLRRGGFETITLGQLFNAEENNRLLPRRPVVVSFDDGFRSFFEVGLPALRARGMRATVFVPAGEIGGTNRWDRSQPSGIPERPIMNEGELRNAADEGTEIGSHGWNHRVLPECNEVETHEEIFRSRQRLRELGFPAEFYAYPYGAFSTTAFPLLEVAGYRGAVAMFTDYARTTSERFAMRRIYIHPGDTRLRFRLKLSPFYLRYAASRGLLRSG